MTFRKPLRRSPRKADPVTPEVRAAVLVRDRGCLAAKMDAGHACRDTWGNPHAAGDLAKLTLDHIRLEPGGKRRSVPSQLVSLCWFAHISTGWATSHRPELRAYLQAVAAPLDPHDTHVDPVAGCDDCNRAVRRGRKAA